MSNADFKHHMIKEIYEQGRVLRDCLKNRLVSDAQGGKIVMPELDGLPVPERLRIIGCGTSSHAGLWAANLLETWAQIPTVVDLASETRYHSPCYAKGEMALAISQSGETADTLAAFNQAKAKGLKIVTICNAPGSTMMRESDAVFYTEAGPELSIASTKAMTAQMFLLMLMAIYWGQRKGCLGEHAAEVTAVLKALPGLAGKVDEVLPTLHAEAAPLAKKYARFGHFLFVGRGLSCPLAREGALKLKETSYIHAEGYSLGEVRHGPMAMVDDSLPTFAILLRDKDSEKSLGNVEEIHSRGSHVLALVNPGMSLKASDVWTIPEQPWPLNSFIALPAFQCFCYEIACALGRDVDSPRNLVKSVGE